MQPDNEKDSGRMPLWQHLDELRTCLIRCLVAVGLGIIVAYNFSDKIVLFLERPLLAILPTGEAHLYFTGVADKFMVYLKASALAGIALTFPYLIHQFWIFVSPGLYKHERRLVLPFVVFASVAFLSGMAFAYGIIIPYGYAFLINFGSPNDKAIITLTEYFSLTIKLMLAVGVVFELPVVMVLLGRFGLVDTRMLAKFRRYAFVGSAVLSAILTPSADAFTMVLVMVPLLALYELGILGVLFFGKKAV